VSPLKRNILANFAGNAWTALMSFAFVPLYIHFLGIEAYGLMGIFATLQAIFGLLDLGLSTTLNREMARLSVQPHGGQQMRNLVRTLEGGYWAIGIVIGVTVLTLAPLIANHWLQSTQISPETIQQAIMLMGLVMVLQWPISFYSGGLLGLQHQVLLNGITVTVATLRGLGAVFILWLVSPTIQAFFIWQLVISTLNTFLVVIFLWRSLPPTGERARFQGQLLREIWRFAAGMSGISLMALILTQLDKVILSKLLTLEMFGYYTLAGSVAAVLSRFFGPLFIAMYPRFTQLVSQGDEEGLKQLYHRGCQLVSVLVLPVAVVMAVFSKEILLLWTQNPTTTGQTAPLLSLLVIGTALNGMMNLPYALQLAYGWTQLAFYINVVAVAVLGPLVYVLASHYGAVGAASVWAGLNSGYVLIGIQLMHRRLLRGEKWRWYVEDFGMPLVGVLVTTSVGSLLFNEKMSQMVTLITLVGILFASVIIALLAASQMRERAFNQLFKFNKVVCT
jgi:O-antigen/teichoic acid export membrane protein